MRIVSGDYKGRSLSTPPGRGTRPTSDRAREAIFNVLTHSNWAPTFNGARIIDLFAGSGALGFEALSRGAAFGLFVETDAGARGVIRENIETLGLFGKTRIHRRSATLLGQKPAGLGAPFSLAFLDPPYGKGLILPALTALQSGGWLSSDAAVMVETAAGEEIDFTGWDVLDTRNYGAADIWFLRLSI